jgi:hypothetical protein
MADGAIADLSFALQTAEGAAAASATYRCFLAGGTIGPARDVGLLSTQSTVGFPTRASYAERYVAGEFEIFARPEPIGLLAYAALGAKAVSGAGPYTHTFTAAATRPWLTFWRMVGNGLLIEQFVDCRVSKLRIVSQTGGIVRCIVTVLGKQAKRRTSNQVTAITVTDPFLHAHGSGLLTVDGAAIAGIREIDVEIDNGDRARPGGLGQGWDIVGGMVRSATIRTTQKIISTARYDLFHYGSTSPADGTVQAVDPATAAADFIWRLSASRELHVDSAALTPSSFAGYEPNVSHDPMVEARTYSVRDGGATSAVRIRLINGVASY